MDLLYSFLISNITLPEITNFARILNRILWYVQSNTLTTFTNTYHVSISNSFLICSIYFFENDPSGHPILGVNPNCVEVIKSPDTHWSLLVITIEITLETTVPSIIRTHTCSVCVVIFYYHSKTIANEWKTVGIV